MQYLFQYPIETSLEASRDLEFDYKTPKIRLLLSKDTDIYTKGKKLQIISDGENFQNALRNINRNLHAFLDRFTVFYKETLNFTGVYEIVLQNQKGENNRILYYDIIDWPSPIDLSNHYIEFFRKFLNVELSPQKIQTIHYLRRAVEAGIADKYLNVFHALESISQELILPKKDEYRVCSGCGGKLVCSNCGRDFKYKPFTENDLCEVLQKLNMDDFFFDGGIKEEAKRLFKYRHRCAHFTKKELIDYNKIINASGFLFNSICRYICTKDGIDLTGFGRDLLASGVHTRLFKKYYIADDPQSEFAFNVPSKSELQQSSDAETIDI